MIQFGLRLHDAEKLPLEQVLPLVRQRGFTCAHLALSKSLKEVPNTPSALTPGYAAYLRRLFAQHGIDIAVLGNYLNLAHPDEDALHAIQEKYYAHIRFASLLGCGMVGTETGAPNAEYKFCPECRSDAALATFIRNFKPVVRCAEQYGVTIAIEPVVKHIVYDAKRARTVLDEIGSPNLQILLDPVNLLNMENVDAREDVFAEAIELLGKDVAMIHFKDFLREDAGGQLAATGAGQGGMGDYRTILRFAKQEKPWVFATLENTTPENSVSACNTCKSSTTRAESAPITKGSAAGNGSSPFCDREINPDPVCSSSASWWRQSRHRTAPHRPAGKPARRGDRTDWS